MALVPILMGYLTATTGICGAEGMNGQFSLSDFLEEPLCFFCSGTGGDVQVIKMDIFPIWEELMAYFHIRSGSHSLCSVHLD